MSKLRFGGEGLSEVPTRDLETLLKRLYRKELPLPVSHPTLLRAGLAHLVDKVDFLSNLDEPAVRAVLVAVIAERRAVEARAARAERA